MLLPIKVAPKCSLRGAHSKVHQQKPDVAMRNVTFSTKWNSSHRDSNLLLWWCDLGRLINVCELHYMTYKRGIKLLSFFRGLYKDTRFPNQ